MSICISPPEVSRWASMVPSPKGTSVMIWFIRTAWAGRRRLPGVLLADLLGGLEPLVGQERVLSATAAYLQVGAVRAGRTVAPRLHCRVQEVGGQAGERAGRDAAAARRSMASLVGGHRVHDVAGDEGGQLGERERDPAGAVEVGVVADASRPRRAASSVGVLLADRAVGLARPSRSGPCRRCAAGCPGAGRR